MNRYRVTFHGRERNAIGITYSHTIDVEALNEESAVLKLYDTHEHISQPHIELVGGHVTRYVITHVDRNGMRTLAHPMQGRYTYATEAEATAALEAMLDNNSLDTLRAHFGLPLEVRAVECYPGHFDPVRCWFDTGAQS